MNVHALGIDLGPLPERPTQPDDPSTADRIYAEAETEINREAKDLNWWIALFDETEAEGVDLTSLAEAMHASHCCDPDAVLDAVAEAVHSTIAALTAQEAKERLDDLEPDPDRLREEQQDRLDALREDHDEWKRDR